MISVTSAFQWAGDKVLAAVLGELDQRMVAAGNQWLTIKRATLGPRRSWAALVSATG